MTKISFEEFSKMVDNTPVSQIEYKQEFISAVIEKFYNGLVLTIDIVQITNELKDRNIKFDIEGPICGDNTLMDIFKKADYLNIYSSESDWLYGAIYEICDDYVRRCAQLIVNKNKH